LARRRKHLVGGGKDKALVRRFLEEVSKGNLNVIDELLAPDFVD
jgi:ketosteroid isomerase-like protein